MKTPTLNPRLSLTPRKKKERAAAIAREKWRTEALASIKAHAKMWLERDAKERGAIERIEAAKDDPSSLSGEDYFHPLNLARMKEHRDARDNKELLVGLSCIVLFPLLGIPFVAWLIALIFR